MDAMPVYGEDIHIGSLTFRSLNVSGRASIAGDIPEGHRRGIYIYRFDDGRWYAGKSENVVMRYVQHRHEYRHAEIPLEVDVMWFAEVSSNDAKKLDDAETKVIASLEKRGFDLVNQMKTKTPGGTNDVITEQAPYFGVSLPWNRLKGTKRSNELLNVGPLSQYESAEKHHRYEQLVSKAYWLELLSALRRYAEETIPALAETAGTLWVATALPSVSRSKLQRMLCVSCGNVETLVIFEENGIPYGFMNVREDKEHDIALPRSSRKPMWTL